MLSAERSGRQRRHSNALMSQSAPKIISNKKQPPIFYFFYKHVTVAAERLWVKSENLLLPFLFNTEDLMLWPKGRCWKVRFYSSPNSLPLHAALLTSPPPKWSHAQPVNHFSAPSFALRLIIILRTNKYLEENWDFLWFTPTHKAESATF